MRTFFLPATSLNLPWRQNRDDDDYYVILSILIMIVMEMLMMKLIMLIVIYVDEDCDNDITGNTRVQTVKVYNTL